MEGDLTNIYGADRSLVSSALGYLLGLVLIVGGFILASRYLIGKRVEKFEREWRASGSWPEDTPEPRRGEDETKPPSGRRD